MIDKPSIVMPIRRRTATLQACLKMLVKHSKFQHEIILVLDRPEQKVADWTKTNSEWLKNNGVKVLESPFKNVKVKDQFGTANASNHGWRNAENDWLMCMDDDMYCGHLWDYNLMRKIRSEEEVYVPINVVPELQVDRTADWSEWYHLTYPKQLTYLRKKYLHQYDVDRHHINPLHFYIKEQEWIKWSEQMMRKGVYREPCGVRFMGHWMPIIIHRKVFERSGGFPPGVGRDIHFDDELGKLGYMKTAVRDSLILHSKTQFRVGK